MLKILHISDLHFGPFFTPKAAEALRNFSDNVDYDVLVTSGDLTQRAKTYQFVEARKYLDSFKKKPSMVVPGNHDVPLYRIFERLFNPYGNYKKYINNKLDSTLKIEGAVFVGLNSTAPYTRTVNGKISEAQLDYCRQQFEGVQEGVVKVVVLHHHLVPTPDFEQSQYLSNAREILSRFSKLDVDMVLAGHAHRGYVGSSLDAYHSKTSERQVAIIQCGTSTSRRGRGRDRDKNSFNMIEVDDSTIRVVRYVYIDSESNFLPVVEYLFPRPSKLHL